MRIMKAVAPAVVFFFSLISISLANGSPQDIVDLQKREAILEVDIIQAIEIANRAKNLKALEVARFLAEGLFIVKPISGGIGLIRGTGGGVVAVLPIIPGDEENLGWEEKLQKNFTSFFVGDPKAPTIVIKNEMQMSELWRGLILIHEGNHALNFTSRIFSDIEEPAERRVIDEYFTYSLEFELLGAIGGEEYKKVLAEEAQKIKESFQRDRGVTEPNYAEAWRLDQAFEDKPLSSYERRFRWTTLFIHAIFTAMDDTYGAGSDKAEEEKLNALYSLYAGGALK